MTSESETPSKKAHLLYVEDDPSLSFVTRDNLELRGYEVTYCENGKIALDAFETGKYDLCIFDVMMPIMDGFTLAEAIRKVDVSIPILFLTAKALKEDRLLGFKLGGDDYVTKPFSIEELVMRIEVFLKRRTISSNEAPTIFTIGSYTFEYDNLLLIAEDGQERTLTQKEADLLRLFAASPGQVLKRAEMLTEVWGEDDYFHGRSMDVFISRLRKYLSKDERLKIENIHGVGFKLKID